jgi:hypothetical protein
MPKKRHTEPTAKPPERIKANTAPKGIDIADLIEYRKKGLSVDDIAKLTGCDHSNVSRRLADADLPSLDNYRTNKDYAFEHLQRRTIKNVTDADIKRMNPLQRITAAAILQDKIQVIRGQATEIIDHRVLTVNLSQAIEMLRKERQEQDSSQDVEIIDCPIISDSSEKQP